MQKRIDAILRKEPGIKARDIAKELELDKKEINAFFYQNPDIYIQDSETFGWSLRGQTSIILEITSNGVWITQDHFEKALQKAGSPLDYFHEHVVIKIPAERKVLFCAAGRILTLANQLIGAGKKVELDFTENPQTLSYLNRAGFVSRLHPAIKILPRKPSKPSSKDTHALVEFLEIGPFEDESSNVPKRLRESFTNYFPAEAEEYANKISTVISEFVGNVQEHSNTPFPGFAGLQAYDRPRTQQMTIVTVVSDAGEGICRTLRPALDEHFPEVAERFDKSIQESDPLLILYAIANGGLSRRGRLQGGSGLHTSHEKALKLDAKITIRQENFLVTLTYKDDSIAKATHKLDLPKLCGTQIVFEFNLTKS